MSHTIRTVVGVFLLILAVIGSLLPLVQGWIFFLAAVGVLGTDHVITKWCFRQMERGKQWVQHSRMVAWGRRQMERCKEWVRRCRGIKDPESKL